MEISNKDKSNYIKYKYFIDYFDYCEIKLQSSPDDRCYKCGKKLEPLTLLEPDFYIMPCWDCSSTRISSREIATDNIIKNIKEFYNKLLGDRYFQLFIVDDIYLKTTFPHNYEVFKRAVISLNPPSRKDIWFLDWIPGYPKIINQTNLKGLKIVNITKLYKEPELNKDVIRVGDYEILLPELIKHNKKSFSRYSIFGEDKKGDRKRKRLKFGDTDIRLYDTNVKNVKSIFKILKDGKEIDTDCLSYQDFVIIKLSLMRDKDFMRVLFDIITETLRTVGTFNDTVFLKNSIVVSTNPKKINNVFNLVWSANSEYKLDNIINISIL
jgi:hypothetical protein